MPPEAQGTKEEMDKIPSKEGFIKIKNLYLKGHYHRSEKTSYKVGENVCKSNM